MVALCASAVLYAKSRRAAGILRFLNRRRMSLSSSYRAPNPRGDNFMEEGGRGGLTIGTPFSLIDCGDNSIMCINSALWGNLYSNTAAPI